jgi:hypothetical protein
MGSIRHEIPVDKWEILKERNVDVNKNKKAVFVEVVEVQDETDFGYIGVWMLKEVFMRLKWEEFSYDLEPYKENPLTVYDTDGDRVDLMGIAIK